MLHAASDIRLCRANENQSYCTTEPSLRVDSPIIAPRADAIPRFIPQRGIDRPVCP